MLWAGAISAFALNGTACESKSGSGPMQVHRIDPGAGGLQGGQQVRIVGENFRTDIGYTVYFGSLKAKTVTLLDSETMIALSPQQTQKGAVDVTVASDNGPAFRIKNGYRYEDMSGNVMEQFGEGPAKSEKSNLAY